MHNAENYNQMSYLSKCINHNVEDIKALFSYNRVDMVWANETRLRANIDCALDSLKEMKALLED